jgi:putative component of membrane protein insertase Oxa1/YidC/SpoIIIJ protein YidD
MKYLLLGFIRLYQIFLSPKEGLLKNFYLFPAHCRFENEESCSVYAYNAIKNFGAFKGLKLALIRFGRCSGFIK